MASVAEQYYLSLPPICPKPVGYMLYFGEYKNGSLINVLAQRHSTSWTSLERLIPKQYVLRLHEPTNYRVYEWRHYCYIIQQYKKVYRASDWDMIKKRIDLHWEACGL